MSISQKRIQLAALSFAVVSRPELMAKYEQKRTDMATFDRDVRTVLESHFQPAQFKSAIAILNSIPHGNLNFVFSAWLNELQLIGALSQSQMVLIREGLAR